jgi:hypothetical protein
MSTPTSVTVSSQTSSAAIPINWRANNFAVGIGCVVNSGTHTYKVQHTFDDIYTVANPTWFDHASLVSKTASADGNYAFPIRAVRLTITAWTSGSTTMTILQAD